MFLTISGLRKKTCLSANLNKYFVRHLGCATGIVFGKAWFDAASAPRHYSAATTRLLAYTSRCISAANCY